VLDCFFSFFIYLIYLSEVIEMPTVILALLMCVLNSVRILAETSESGETLIPQGNSNYTALQRKKTSLPKVYFSVLSTN